MPDVIDNFRGRYAEFNDDPDYDNAAYWEVGTDGGSVTTVDTVSDDERAERVLARSGAAWSSLGLQALLQSPLPDDDTASMTLDRDEQYGTITMSDTESVVSDDEVTNPSDVESLNNDHGSYE